MASNTDYGLGPDPIEYPLYAPVPLYPPTLPPILNGADANTPISSYPPNLVEPQPEGFDVMPHMPTGDESTLDGGHGAPDFLMLTGVLTDPSTHSEVSASTEVETAEKAYTTLSSPFSSSKSSKSSALSKSSRVVKAEAREKFENVRKAHFRATSEAVGFEVTDPYVWAPINLTTAHTSPYPEILLQCTKRRGTIWSVWKDTFNGFITRSVLLVTNPLLWNAP